jgi:outer membrane receptor protein involved in Fe transport
LTEQRIDYFYPYASVDYPAHSPYPYLATNILPNELLKPEKTESIEMGYRQSIGAVTLDMTLYQMKIKEQITSVHVLNRMLTLTIPTVPPTVVPVPNTVYQFQNRGSSTNTGGELAMTWVVQKNWKIGANGRFMEFTQDDLNIATWPTSWNGELSYAPKTVLTAWTRFTLGGFSGYVDVQHFGAAHAEGLRATGQPGFDERPAYLQGDVQFGYELIKGMNLGLYARNAAREYTLQGSTGPVRPPVYQVQRREVGVMFAYHF